MKKVHTLAIDQKEDAKHGESFFPVQKYITNLSSEYMGVTNHWHEEAELTLITSGKCIYKIDLVEYEVEEGDILFVPPLFLHSITLGNNATSQSGYGVTLGDRASSGTGTNSVAIGLMAKTSSQTVVHTYTPAKVK